MTGYQPETAIDYHNFDRLLAISLLLAIISSLSLGIGIYLFSPSDIVGLSASLFVAANSCVAYYLLRKNRRQLASTLHLFVLWLIFMSSFVFQEGVNNPGFGGVILLIFAAGLLIGSRAGIYLAAISGLATAIIIFAEQLGWVPILPAGDTVNLFVGLMHIIFFGMSAALLLLFFERITKTLAISQENEAALAESEMRIRALVEGYFEGFIISVNGVIVEANQAMAVLLGYKNPNEVVGLSYKQFHVGESIALVEQAIKSGIETPYEVQIVRQDGTIFPAEVMGRNAVYMNQPARIVALRDMTQQKEAERQLIQAQKLESLGLMAGGVAHDFNNLLLAIIGQNSVAVAKLSATHPAHKHVEKSLKAAQRAANLTKQLLAYSGQGHFHRQPIDLNLLIRENTDLLALATNHQVSLQLDLAEPLPLIVGDEGQMQQLLMNLLINAAEAGDGVTSLIRIETAVVALENASNQFGNLLNQIVAAGNYVQLTVEDDGPGISDEARPKIFEPFFSTKGTGRGLGLAAILGIVRGHQGGLVVESQVGVGTTFRLLFPVQIEKASNHPAVLTA